jgi:site-specific recombinase XerD
VKNELQVNKNKNGLVERNNGMLSENTNIFDNIVLCPVEQYKLSLGSNESVRTAETRIKVCAIIWGCKDRSQIIWNKLTKAHVLGIVKTLEHQGKKIATIKNTLSCLKSVIKEAYDLDMIESENYHKIMSVRPPKGFQEETGVALDVSSIRKLLDHIGSLSDSKGIRDNAIVSLLVSTGLRKAEATNILLSNIDFSTQQILIKGKGNKERKVGLNQTAFNAIQKWLTEVRGTDEGYLFTRIRKNGKMNPLVRFSDQSIYDIAKDRCGEVGIKIATHDLRRTFITFMLSNGVDVLDVMKMAGHSSPETTKRYDKSGQNKALDIMKKSMF